MTQLSAPPDLSTVFFVDMDTTVSLQCASNKRSTKQAKPFQYNLHQIPRPQHPYPNLILHCDLSGESAL